MRSVLLAPHNDDETLFASFLILRHHPRIVVCLRSHVQGNNYAKRELETARALDALLVHDARAFTRPEWEQWPFPDNDPDWPKIRKAISGLAKTYDHVFAPMPRFNENGHDPRKVTPTGAGILQHDRIGQMALDAFGAPRFTGYTTYLRWGGRDTNGVEVEYESSWPALKLTALACYTSQLERVDTVPHFIGGDLREYVNGAWPE